MSVSDYTVCLNCPSLASEHALSQHTFHNTHFRTLSAILLMAVLMSC